MTTNALMELADRVRKIPTTWTYEGMLAECESIAESITLLTDRAPAQTKCTRTSIFSEQCHCPRCELRTAAAEGGAVYATVTGLTSEDGKHELYTITDEPFPLSDPWKLYTHPPTDSGAGRDGERYRWLRNSSPEEIRVRVQGSNPIHPHLWAYYSLSGESLDTAIDNAIAGAAGE